jgi:hypothetical protein
MALAKTQAYFLMATITTVKSFVGQSPGVKVIHLFSSLLTTGQNKLERLSLTSTFLYVDRAYPSSGAIEGEVSVI